MIRDDISKKVFLKQLFFSTITLELMLKSVAWILEILWLFNFRLKHCFIFYFEFYILFCIIVCFDVIKNLKRNIWFVISLAKIPKNGFLSFSFHCYVLYKNFNSNINCEDNKQSTASTISLMQKWKHLYFQSRVDVYACNV